jgi:hypothetical protein
VDLVARTEGGVSLNGEFPETGVRGRGGLGGDEVGSDRRRLMSLGLVWMRIPPRGCWPGGENAGFGGLRSEAESGEAPRDDMAGCVANGYHEPLKGSGMGVVSRNSGYRVDENNRPWLNVALALHRKLLARHVTPRPDRRSAVDRPALLE